MKNATTYRKYIMLRLYLDFPYTILIHHLDLVLLGIDDETFGNLVETPPQRGDTFLQRRLRVVVSVGQAMSERKGWER